MPHPQAPLSPPQSPNATSSSGGNLEYFPSMPSRMASTAKAIPTAATNAVQSNTANTQHTRHRNVKSFVRSLCDKRKGFWKLGGSSPPLPVVASKKQVVDGPQITQQPSPPLEEVQKPLTPEELTTLFSGAPNLALYPPTSSGSPYSLSNAPIPTVTFPYTQPTTELPLASDHVPFPAHPSFSLCSTSSDPSHGLIDKLDPLPSELPPMHAFQGLEVGSVGWEYFILSPIGDINSISDDEDERDSRLDLVDEGGRERGMAMWGKELAGVMRSVEVEWVVQRLQELGELYWVGRTEGDKVDSGDDTKASEVATMIIPGTPEDANAQAVLSEKSNVEASTSKSKTLNNNPGILSKYNPLELYTNLFTQLLYPPTKIITSDYHDPYSLKVQIAALTQALGMNKVWLDFSLVEWRIRLGQVLWGGNWAQMGTGVNGNNTERVWLLLQILLACELVVRLDAVAASDITPGDQGIGGIGGSGQSKEDLFKYFREIRRKKVEWDIFLARRWLENVVLVQRESASSFPLPIPEHQPSPSDSLSPLSGSPTKKKGWFSSLSSSDASPAPATPAGTKYDPSQKTNNPAYDALIIPRDQTTQLSGLLFFAREINWPQVQTLSHALVDNLVSYHKTHHAQFGYKPPSIPSTPYPDTPGLSSKGESPLVEQSLGASMVSSLTNWKNYFTTAPPRPRRLRELSSRSSLKRSGSFLLRKKESSHALMRNNTMGSGGWLSRSWFTGLVLPGESMIHFLISTLLENDVNVGEKVGWEAELYGGFLLSTAGPDEEKGMWWSSFCIVGKVLGDYSGGKECMGWIGVGKGVRIITAGNEDEEEFSGAEDVEGWVAVRCKLQGVDEDGEVVQPAPLERVFKPKEVSRMGCILGRGWKEGIAVMKTDFIIPSLGEADGTDVEIELEGLIFRHDDYVSEDEEEDEEIEGSSLTSYDVEVSFLVTENFRTERGNGNANNSNSNNNSNNTINNNNGDEGDNGSTQENTRRIIFHLSHDVTFITAYPCCLPSTANIDSHGKDLHHLHKSHVYTIYPLAALPALPCPINALLHNAPTFSSAVDGNNNRLAGIHAARKAKIVVINASGAGQAGEVFAKAWCADRGVSSALLAREGRGCLSCAIREAGALGIPVVIWMGKKVDKGESYGEQSELAGRSA